MADKVKITVKSERTLLLPTLPNFIRTETEEGVDISTLTEEQLREIGKHWTDALVRKARERKADVIRALNREIQRNA
jgi:hypothetical protein